MMSKAIWRGLFQVAVLAAACSFAAADSNPLCLVRSTADAGEGTLRNCLDRAAASTVTVFTIQFAPSLAGQSITALSTYPQVNTVGQLVVRGIPGLTITAEASRTSEIFHTGPGVSVDYSLLNVVGGQECFRLSDGIVEGTRDISVVINGVTCTGTFGSGLFNRYPTSSMTIVNSQFTGCGTDGVLLDADIGPTGPYAYKFDRVITNGNGNTGVGLFNRASSNGGTLFIKNTEMNNNANYGFEGSDNNFLRATLVARSTFNGNNEGFEIKNGAVDRIKACEFNGNVEYGIGLNNAALTTIQNSLVDDNGSWGIDLTPEANVQNILRTKIKNNANGVVRCGQELSEAREAAAKRSTGDNDAA